MAQIKSRTTREILFEYEGLLKETVEEAVRQGISLEWADFRYADLSGADLNEANLRCADLRGANLNGANLNNANLKVADLILADLRGADLNGVNLILADLEGADLNGANIKGADLKGANLKEADLSGADLRETNLRYADLKGANLKDANFCDADLDAADLKFAKNIPDDLIPLVCPAEGSFIAWKRVDDKLVKLEISKDAKRSSATTNKCRCSKAMVLVITNLGETETYNEVVNNNYVPLTYKVGEMVYPDSFDENRWNECSHGIHFFMDKVEAINW